MTRRATSHTQLHGLALLLALFLTVPLNAYDDTPTSEKLNPGCLFFGYAPGEPDTGVPGLLRALDS